MAMASIEWPAGFSQAPYRVLHDPAVYELEQQRFFRGPLWFFLCLEAEIPIAGDFKATFIGETPVVVTRDRDRNIHSFVNRCAHRGSLVCLESSGTGRHSFTCVYHAWSYDVRGNLTGAAFRQGIDGKGGLPADFALKDHGLEKVRIEVFCGMAFGTLSSAAPPLASYLGVVDVAIQRVMNRPVRILGYDSQIINANWKTYGENTRDSYHANILHTFFGTFGISRHSQESAVIVDPQGMHYYTYTKRGTERASSDYASTASSLRSVKTDLVLQDPSILDWTDEFGDGSSTYLTTIFPCCIIAQIQHSLAVRQLLPKGPEKCELIFTYFGYEDDSPELTAQRLKQHNLTGSAGLVSLEDGAICEFVGAGTKGCGDATSFMEMGGKGLNVSETTKISEMPLRQFWDHYRRVMDF